MIDLSRDLDHMLKHTPGSVKVVFGSQRTWGLIDLADEEMFASTRSVNRAEASVIGERRILTVRTGALTGLGQGDAITVDGSGYTIVGPPQRAEDGRLTLLPLGDA